MIRAPRDHRLRARRAARAAFAAALFAAVLFLPAFAGEDKPAPAVSSSVPLKLGFIGHILENWQDQSNGLQVRRARLALTGQVMKGLRFRANVDLAKTPTLLDLFAEFDLAKPLGLRLGQFLIPFSLENVTSVADMEVINRSLIVETFAPGRDIKSQGRDVGLVGFGKASIFEYAGGVVNGSGINRPDANKHKDLAGRLLVKPLSWLSLGGSLYVGKQSLTATSPLATRDRSGLEMSMALDRVIAKGEYIHATDGPVKHAGWYLLAGAFVDPGRKLQPLARIEALDPDTALPGDRHNAATLGLNWYLTGKTRLMLNYEHHWFQAGPSTNDLYAQFQLVF